MTFLVGRLVELVRYLKHLKYLRPRVKGSHDLEHDLSRRNDVLFSLLMVCQLVIDISGELSARRGERFEDYTQAIRNLAADARFPARLVQRLEKLPWFRNILVHAYAVLDLERVIEALDDLAFIEEFQRIVTDLAGDS